MVVLVVLEALAVLPDFAPLTPVGAPLPERLAAALAPVLTPAVAPAVPDAFTALVAPPFLATDFLAAF
ncbi:hypothetical protein CDN98_05555 [Roseateles terrae]|nr:hypothetical protein CDN98_05555 [Roseateles terrae]